MKIFGVILAFFLLSASAWAGGLSSNLEFTRVDSIDIQNEKIVFTGSFVFHMSLPTEGAEYFHNGRPKDSTAITTRVEKGTVVLIPDYSEPKIVNLFIGGASPEKVLKEHKAMFEQLWKNTLERANALRGHQNFHIGFQGELVTITGGRIVEVRGYGRLAEVENIEQDADAKSDRAGGSEG